MAASTRSISDSVNAMERELVLTRVFDAPRALVFDAWAKVEHLQKWWGCARFTNPVCEVDFRLGGKWWIVMRGPDGKEYPCGGEYLEIVPVEKLVFTNNAVDKAGKPLLEGMTTVLLEEFEGKTHMTVKTRAKGLVDFAPQMLAGMELGWSASLDRLTEDILGQRAMVISRLYDAPREMVWDAWTDPKQIVKWWGPNGFTTTIEVMDVRPGGEWRSVMHGPDGTDYPNFATFQEVVRPERIVFSHGGGKAGGPEADFVATWTFVDEGGKTRLILQNLFESVERRDLIAKAYGAMEGGYQTLARLEEWLGR